MYDQCNNYVLYLTGQSALHLAIVNGDFDSVKLLVENGANVNQRATGKFFLPEDHKKNNKKKTEYSGKRKSFLHFFLKRVCFLSLKSFYCFSLL